MGKRVKGIEKRKAKILPSALPYLEGETVAVMAIVQPSKQAIQAMMGATPWVQFLLVATESSIHLFSLSPLKNVITGHLDRIPIETAQVGMEHGVLLVGPARLAPLVTEERLPEVLAWVQQRQAPAAPPPPPPPPAAQPGFSPPPPAPPPPPGWQPHP